MQGGRSLKACVVGMIFFNIVLNVFPDWLNQAPGSSLLKARCLLDTGQEEELQCHVLSPLEGKLVIIMMVEMLEFFLKSCIFQPT